MAGALFLSLSLFIAMMFCSLEPWLVWPAKRVQIASWSPSICHQGRLATMHCGCLAGRGVRNECAMWTPTALTQSVTLHWSDDHVHWEVDVLPASDGGDRTSVQTLKAFLTILSCWPSFLGYQGVRNLRSDSGCSQATVSVLTDLTITSWV